MPITNYVPNSRIAQPGVCTSSTRPSTPYEGQVIYETDTDKVLVWNGAVWFPNWNMPWGIVAQEGSYATTSFSANTNLTVLSTTFTAYANRRYMVWGRIGIQILGSPATPNALWIAQTNLGVRTLAYKTTAIAQYYCEMFEGSVHFQASDLGVSSGSASKTIDMKWRCGTNGGLNTDPDAVVGTNSLPHQLTVIDMGPF